MTRKKLLEAKEEYKEQIKKRCEVWDNNDLYLRIASMSIALADEMCYDHHERGQRLWAYVQALRELGVISDGR